MMNEGSIPRPEIGYPDDPDSGPEIPQFSEVMVSITLTPQQWDGVLSAVETTLELLLLTERQRIKAYLPTEGLRRAINRFAEIQTRLVEEMR